MLTEGYAIGTINMRLATVRTYARLAHLAGVIPADTYSRIRALSGYRRSEGDNLDQQRVATDQSTRIAAKKATANILTTSQIIDLKHAPWRNPTTRSEAVAARDALLICLLVDLGLRCGEVALLIGIANLSPHDLRHSWATRLAQLQVPIQALRDAGGWSNFAMPGRYVAQQAIANDRIPLANDLVAESAATEEQA
ncbi:tyrosine-type recombinase/integrase [Herpetosiphon gulosus]|uniref:Tyr recombinase domain-containing protein n=1 Tax=Herpetosiphon gulosus TaxID=1973496 RepID=A0ABP9X9M3_9CHLR